MGITGQILDEFNAFEFRNSRFKKIAPMYPEIYSEKVDGNVINLTCWVEFVYNGIRFKRHHVESGIISEFYTEEQLRDRLEHEVALTKEKAAPCWLDEIIRVEEETKS